MRLEKVMNRDVIFTEEDTLVIRAAGLMKEKGIGCLLVGQQEKPVGILTGTDILYKVTVKNLDPNKTLVNEVMTSPLITIQTDESVIFAEELMERYHIRHLPVMEKGRVMGVVSIRDILLPLKHFENLSTHDSLTGLLNQQAFYRRLKEEITRSRRFGHPFALLMVDIDHFKKVNDTFGHPVGDRVLKAMSSMIRGEVRSVDQIARYGGEEFTLLLPETNRGNGLSKAEKIRENIAGKGIRINPGKDISITVSIGVAIFPEDEMTSKGLVDKADQALYAAKKAGRNKVYPLT